MDMVHEARNYGVETTAGKFDWPFLKEARDSYIKRLNGIYDRNLANSGVKVIQGVSADVHVPRWSFFTLAHRSIKCGKIFFLDVSVKVTVLHNK